MKLFILAALIAVSSAARLEHLERGYLPPDQAGRGQGSFGSHGSNGLHSSFGSHGSNFGSSADSAGFGSSPQGSRTGPANFRGVSSFEAAQSNQYLPPDHGPSGSHGFGHHGASHGQDAFGASSNQNQFGARPNSQYGAPQFGQNSFGTRGSFGSQSSGFGSQGSSDFSSQGFDSQSSNALGSQGFGSNQRTQQAKSLRQYLAPKTTSSFDKIPQQAFDEETGYHY